MAFSASFTQFDITMVDVTDLFPTLAELAGIEVPSELRVDGRSFADLINGDSPDSERSWIMAMGGQNNAQVCERGVENEYNYRDRVIRDKEYKLYIAGSPDRGPTKLFNLLPDPYESTNLLETDDPEAAAALERLSAIVAAFPAQDAEPRYLKRAANEWDVEVSVQCQSWKK